MKKYYFLYTKYGTGFAIDQKGRIKYYKTGDKLNTSDPYNNFSDNWRVLGIKHTKKNLFISWDKVMELIDKEEEPEWLYKTTQNPQWTIVDLDYGTTRVWGNTKAHGIWYIRKLNY